MFGINFSDDQNTLICEITMQKQDIYMETLLSYKYILTPLTSVESSIDDFFPMC